MTELQYSCSGAESQCVMADGLECWARLAWQARRIEAKDWQEGLAQWTGAKDWCEGLAQRTSLQDSRARLEMSRRRSFNSRVPLVKYKYYELALLPAFLLCRNTSRHHNGSLALPCIS